MSNDDKIKFKWIDTDADANFRLGEVSAGAKYRSDTGAVTSLNLINVGAKVGVSTLKVEKGFEDGTIKLSAQGPSASGDVGVQCNHERIGINAMAEASAAKAKASAGPAFVEANLNANTGAKVGTDGVKVGVLGFGLTLGVGGRWSVDTPVGSAGCGDDDDDDGNTNSYTNMHMNLSSYDWDVDTLYMHMNRNSGYDDDGW